MPAFVRVELTVDGHPEFDRAIELPTRAPREWIFEAYRLSVGLEPQEGSEYDGIDDCHHDEPYGYPWAEVPDAGDIPGLPHDPMIVVRTMDTPPIGTPWVTVSSVSAASCVASESESASAGTPSGWLTAEAPFREDDVNRELLRRHGVVQPYVDDSDLWFVDPRLPVPSPISTLVSVVTPARRLALLEHIDATGLLQPAAPDFGDAESALAAVARLVDRLGAEGIEQDAEGGWIPQIEIDRIVNALGWDATLGEVRARGEALVAFARRARLIRRFRGRVVATALACTIRVPAPQTLERLAAMVVSAEPGWHDSRSSRAKAAEAVALLAIADGSADRLDALPALVAAGSPAFAESDLRVRLDDGESSGEGVGSSGGEGEVATRMGVLSAPNAFGIVTPAMREVARCALLSGFSKERYA